jgi:hypothetical protein
MKIKFVFAIILALAATASAQAEITFLDLFASGSPPKLLPGGFGVALTGSLGIVGMTGTMGFKGKTAPFNVGFSDITKNVGPAVLGTFEVSKGAFFLMSDVAYAKLSPSVDSPVLDVALDVQVFSADILTGYKAAHRLGSVDFFAGGRYTSMDLKMDLDLSDLIENKIATRIDQLPPKFRDPVLRLYPKILASAPVSALFDRKIELSPYWVDLFAGTRLLFDLGHGVRFAFRGEAGGLIAFMWHVVVGFDFQFSEYASAAIDYRYLHYSFERAGSLFFDAGMTGPDVALKIKF